jgi:hypothetical protein
MFGYPSVESMRERVQSYGSFLPGDAEPGELYRNAEYARQLRTERAAAREDFPRAARGRSFRHWLHAPAFGRLHG